MEPLKIMLQEIKSAEPEWDSYGFRLSFNLASQHYNQMPDEYNDMIQKYHKKTDRHSNINMVRVDRQRSYPLQVSHNTFYRGKQAGNSKYNRSNGNHICK